MRTRLALGAPSATSSSAAVEPLESDVEEVEAVVACCATSVVGVRSKLAQLPFFQSTQKRSRASSLFRCAVKSWPSGPDLVSSCVVDCTNACSVGRKRSGSTGSSGFGGAEALGRCKASAVMRICTRKYRRNSGSWI